MMQLHFDSYKSAADWQWNEKCKKLYTTRSIKKDKKEKGWTQKKNKMLWNKIPNVQVKQNNAKSWKFN